MLNKHSAIIKTSKMSKVIRANYFPPMSIFKIPKTIDIEDKTLVKGYWVKYETLYIEFVDTTRETLEIEPYISATDDNGDFKYPENIKIEDGADYGISDIEEEE